jgi:polar amino acid transport system substrate-binding protein
LIPNNSIDSSYLKKDLQMKFKKIYAPIARILMLGLLSLSLVGCAIDFDALTGANASRETNAAQATAAVRQALAPSGVLRVGVYLGSPTSWVKDPKSGESVGIALDLGKELAKRLNVPVKVVEFDRLALVLDSLKDGKIDFTFTNATAVRAKDMDFTVPLVRLELGYLVLGDSKLQSVTEIDIPGVRVGVSQGSSSQGVLTQLYKQAKVVPADSLAKAKNKLETKQIDAFATNKGILFEMSDTLPSSQVIQGRWGLENLAIAIPKGRDAGREFVQSFANNMSQSGLLNKVIVRSGLRGTAKD